MTSNFQSKRRYPFKRQMSRKLRRILFMLVAAALASGINYYKQYFKVDDLSRDRASNSEVIANKSTSSHVSNIQQNQAIKKISEAKDNTNAQFWVGFNGKIIKKLKDDNTGSRHQKFLVSPISGMTLLVAHNIDLAQRVPISLGDSISLYGRYEWNNRGGVIHWTHHDPKGKKQGGWIKINGKVYR